MVDLGLQNRTVHPEFLQAVGCSCGSEVGEMRAHSAVQRWTGVGHRDQQHCLSEVRISWLDLQ